MPIPQFHRTPKTRKRRMRRGTMAPEPFDAPDAQIDIDAEARAPATSGDGENCALLQPGDVDDCHPASPEEVPVLLSGWPLRGPK